MVSSSAQFNNVVASLMPLRVSSFLEILALASVGVAWIFFFDTSAQMILLWTFLNVYAILPVIMSFVVLSRAGNDQRPIAPGLIGTFIVVEVLNLFASGSAVAIFIIDLTQCDLPGCTFESLLVYLLVASSVIVAASLIGIISAGIALNLYRKLPPSFKTRKP